MGTDGAAVFRLLKEDVVMDEGVCDEVSRCVEERGRRELRERYIGDDGIEIGTTIRNEIRVETVLANDLEIEAITG